MGCKVLFCKDGLWRTRRLFILLHVVHVGYPLVVVLSILVGNGLCV